MLAPERNAGHGATPRHMFTPENTGSQRLLRIARDFPGAYFVHIIRDPRDVVLSLDKRGWTRPLPWDRSRRLLAAGLYWEWIVRLAKRYGRRLGEGRYLEVRYEALVKNQRETLSRLGRFLDHDLDYDRIQSSKIGSVKNPLTSFKEDLGKGEFMPVGRWKTKLPPEQLRKFEALIGTYMTELGYELSEPKRKTASTLPGFRWIYRFYYPFKQWAKVNTPLSRWMVDYSAILIDK